MQILAGSYNFSQELGCYLFIQSAFSFQHCVKLSLCAVLQDQIKIIVIFIMVMQLHNVFMIQIVHYLNFQLYLFNQVMLNYLSLVDNFNSEHVFRYLMPHFVHFSKSTHTYVGVSQRFKIILSAFSFLSGHHRRGKKQNPILDVIYSSFKFRRYYNLGFHL